jgi:hypothetical protein
MAEDKKNHRDPLNDELNRRPFAKRIADLIGDIAEGKEPLIQDNNKDNNKDNDKGGFTIGIEGEWGEGKTHTIELIKEEIETYNENKEKPIEWMVFNPWHFTDRQHLASLFLRDLAVFIEKNTKSKLRLWVEKNFLWVGRLLGSIFYFFYGLIKPVYPDIATVLLDYAELFEKLKDNRPTKTLETLKDDIKKKLNSNLPFSHIVVAVEDMDRLNPEEIRTMLQLMKMIADFPRITYLLAYDRTHVVNALGDLVGHRSTTEEAREYGEGYLKKVIQAAYTLPIPPEDAIADLMLKQFKQRAKEFHGENFDKSYYFSRVWHKLKDLIKTMRMSEQLLNRAMNIMSHLGKNSNPADILAVAYLMAFQNDAWKKWSEYYRQNLDTQGHSKLLYIFNEIEPRPPEQHPITSKIRALITEVSKASHSIFYTTTPEREYPYRLSNPNYTDMYFSYKPTLAVKIEDIINSLLQTISVEEEKKLLDKLNWYSFSDIIPALEQANKQSPMDWSKQALPLLTHLGAHFDNLENPGSRSLCEYALSFIEEQPEIKQFHLLKTLLGHWLANGAQFWPMKLLDMLGIKKGYVRLNNGAISSEFFRIIISQEQFEELKEIVEEQLTKRWTHGNSLESCLNHQQASNLLFMWLRLNPEQSTETFKKWLNDPFQILTLLEAVKRHSIESFIKEIGWTVAQLIEQVEKASNNPHTQKTHGNLINYIRTHLDDSPHA